MLSTSSHGQEGSQQLSLVQHSPAVIGGSDGKKSKPRTSITPKQLEVLTLAYNEDQHPSKQVREELVATTGLEMKVTCITLNGMRYRIFDSIWLQHKTTYRITRPMFVYHERPLMHWFFDHGHIFSYRIGT